MNPRLEKLRPSPALGAILAALFVAVATGGIFYHVLTADLTAREDRQTVQAARVWSQHWEGWRRLFTHRTTLRPIEGVAVYQPLAFMSLMLNATLIDDWRAAAYSFHLVNLSLHITNTVLLMLLARRLSRSLAWATILALLFALHPVQIETVMSISQRGTLLGTTFALLAIGSYLRIRTSRASAWIIPVTFFYAAAVLCRPIFAALPVALLTLDLWPLRRAGAAPLLEKIPMFLLMIGTWAMHLVNRGASRPVTAADADRVELVSHTITALVGRFAWPARLSAHQPLETTIGGAALGAWFDIAFCVLALAVLFVAFVKGRALFVAVAGAIVVLLPAALDAAYSERLLGDSYLYAVPLLPIAAAAAWFGARPHLFRRLWERWSAIGLACILPLLALQSFDLSLDWQSSLRLYQRTVSRYPTWPFGHIGVVESYLEENELDAALAAARHAVRVAPEHAGTQFYLGTALLLHPDARSAEAIAPLRKALETDSDWIECLQNLGVALARSGHTEEAITYLERARDLSPNSPTIRLGLGNAYLKVERFASARGEFQEALKQRNDAMAHLGLAIAWAANDVPEHARRHLAAAVAIDPEYALRAGRSPELMKLRGKPGFEELIRIPGTGDEDVTLFPPSAPAARRARGS